MYFVLTGLWIPAHASFPLHYPESPKPHSFWLSILKPQWWREDREDNDRRAELDAQEVHLSLVLCTLVMRGVISAQ